MRFLIRIECRSGNRGAGEHGVKEVFKVVGTMEDSRDAQPAARHRKNSQQNQRQQHNPGRLVHAMTVRGLPVVMLGDRNRMRILARMDRRQLLAAKMVFIKALGTEKRLEPQAEHVKRGQSRRDEPDRPHHFAQRRVRCERLVQDFILGEEAGERWDAGDGEDSHGHRPKSDGDAPAQSAHNAHVLFATQRMDHGPSREEQKRFEERVRHHVEDRGRISRNAAGEKHVAQLRHGRVSQHPLDIVLHQPHAGRKNRGSGADRSHPR